MRMAYALLRARYRSWPAEVKNREIGEADEILEGASGGDAAEAYLEGGLLRLGGHVPLQAVADHNERVHC